MMLAAHREWQALSCLIESLGRLGFLYLGLSPDDFGRLRGNMPHSDSKKVALDSALVLQSRASASDVSVVCVFCCCGG